jgi:hypothetical protein
LFLLILPPPNKLLLLGIAWEAERLFAVPLSVTRGMKNFELVSLSVTRGMKNFESGTVSIIYCYIINHPKK